MISLFQQRHPGDLQLKWIKLPDLPEPMVIPQAVIVDSLVYVTDKGADNGVIYRLDRQEQQWTELPEYHCWNFTMVEVDQQLMLVGGKDESTKKPTNAIVAYSTSQRKWEKCYPPMNKPRRHPAVFTYQQHLVVAGGRDANDDKLSEVEVLDMSTKQWFTTTPLPKACSRMSPVIICDMLYLLGGSLNKKVFSVSLPALKQSSAEWCTLPDVPLEYSTAFAVEESLLVVGGKSTNKQRSSDIHVYDQKNSEWTKVGELPSEREDCACCLLPSEIFVAGGEDKDGRTKEAHVAPARLFAALIPSQNQWA